MVPIIGFYVSTILVWLCGLLEWVMGRTQQKLQIQRKWKEHDSIQQDECESSTFIWMQ